MKRRFVSRMTGWPIAKLAAGKRMIRQHTGDRPSEVSAYGQHMPYSTWSSTVLVAAGETGQIHNIKY